jgi:hypothetical protein
MWLMALIGLQNDRPSTRLRSAAVSATAALQIKPSSQICFQY